MSQVLFLLLALKVKWSHSMLQYYFKKNSFQSTNPAYRTWSSEKVWSVFADVSNNAYFYQHAYFCNNRSFLNNFLFCVGVYSDNNVDC